MDDFGTFARDFGFRAQGKSAPMAPPKANVGSDGVDGRARSSSFRENKGLDESLFSDVFGGPPKYTTASNSKSVSSLSDLDYDSIFESSENTSKNVKSPGSGPVYDKPVYDEDIFEGLPGLKSKSVSSKVSYEEDIFASSSLPQNKNQSSAFDVLLGDFGRTEKSEQKSSQSSASFDDLIPGFGGITSPGNSRPYSESSRLQKASTNSAIPTSDEMENPFVDLETTSTTVGSESGLFNDPLEEISRRGNSGSIKTGGSSVSGGLFDDIDPLNGFGKSTPTFSSDANIRFNEESPLRERSSAVKSQPFSSNVPTPRSSFRDSDIFSESKMSANNVEESHSGMFDIPGVSTDYHNPVGQAAPPSDVNFSFSEARSPADVSPGSEELVEPPDDVWLCVSEIPLFTLPTSAPPPSRPPPPIPTRPLKSQEDLFTSNTRKKSYESTSFPASTQYSQSPMPTVSQIDELEDFAMGRSSSHVDEYTNFPPSEEVTTNSSAAASAAAMKDAMDRAEAKFRQAKEVRERENAKTGRSKEAVQQQKVEQTMQDNEEREHLETQERLDRERRQKDEEDRERRRLEKEREKTREIEREREKGRQAVERATREARERAGAEARRKSERVAVGRAQAEARERAERAAVQRANAEARERAAAEARERAERAAAEARERANAEAREKEAREKTSADKAEARRRSERAAMERASAEARERAAAEARERAAASARMNQQNNDNDLESFFSMGSRPTSASRPRAGSSDPAPSPQFQSKVRPEGTRTSSAGASSNMRKASSTTSIGDDLSSIFGAAPSSGGFQDVEGETEERRRARLERHQRTQERAAKALAEKNQRDLQSQRDQEERNRIGETLDAEIRRWSAGKEGNLRALLSTLQYVLWPECGWQPVSLTDLIIGASVKKAYRKATLCIHPDKVQQKGATLQQKYVAEKVFDLLKEAWNKFNSEELF